MVPAEASVAETTAMGLSTVRLSIKMYPLSPRASSETFFPETVWPASMRIAPLFTMETFPSEAVAPSCFPMPLSVLSRVMDVPESVVLSVAVTAPLCVIAPPAVTSRDVAVMAPSDSALELSTFTSPAVP